MVRQNVSLLVSRVIGACGGGQPEDERRGANIRPTAKVEVLALEKSLDFSRDKKNLKEMLLRDIS